MADLTKPEIDITKSEKEAVKKIQKMMQVSKRLRVDMMREALGMDMKAFSTKMAPPCSCTMP